MERGLRSVKQASPHPYAAAPSPARTPPRPRRHSVFCFGSSASRTPAPTALKASTVTVRARPEYTASHGLLKMLSTPDLIMLPQLGHGGCTPRPRKLKLASVRMAVAIQRVDMTEMGPKMLGSTCLNKMRVVDAP